MEGQNIKVNLHLPSTVPVKSRCLIDPDGGVRSANLGKMLLLSYEQS